jgi:ATP-dependent Lon protease
MDREYNFIFKDHYINITHYLTGVMFASVRSDDDYFTKKYIDYTRTEIIENIKQEINQRGKQ